MAVVLRRLSTCPTIPEMMDAEFAEATAHLQALASQNLSRLTTAGGLAGAGPRWRHHGIMLAIRVNLGVASAVLGVATILLRWKVIDAASGLRALTVATRLSRSSTMLWRRGRRSVSRIR
jgi:hypothetical protein